MNIGEPWSSSLPADVWTLRAPCLNANDETVVLTRLLVEGGSHVSAGTPLVEIETAKAATELAAEADGVVVFAAQPGTPVKIGQPLAYVAADRVAIDAVLANVAEGPPGAAASAATPKARRLADRYGIDLAAVAPTAGSVKEADVLRHLASLGVAVAAAAPVPAPTVPRISAEHRARMVDDGVLSAHQRTVIRNLRTALSRGVFTTLDFTLDLSGARRRMAAELAAGRNVSLLPLMVEALAATLPQFPLLMSAIDGDSVVRHPAPDVAFVARSLDGRLFTPVVRYAATQDLAGLAKECARLSKQAMKGRLDAADLDGAAITLSLIPTPGVSAFVALPAPFQACIVSVGAERQEIHVAGDGTVSTRPVATAVANYDHSLCDGITVAGFLAAVNRALDGEPVA